MIPGACIFVSLTKVASFLYDTVMNATVSVNTISDLRWRGSMKKIKARRFMRLFLYDETFFVKIARPDSTPPEERIQLVIQGGVRMGCISRDAPGCRQDFL